MAQGRYAWGDGRGKVHSIPLSEHKTNVKALHALGGNTDLTAPPTGVQAYREAQAAANAQYGPQVQAAQQLQTNVQPWFQDFMARVAGYERVRAAQAAPVLTQAQGYQQGAAAQTAPGLDPNSDAGKQAAQAASGRQALAQLGLDALNTQNTAQQNYFGGQQAMAAHELPAAQTAAAERVANAKTQRGNAATTFLTTARQNAQNYAIARGTLGLNTTKAQIDAAQGAAAITERTRHDRATTKIAAQNAKNAATQGYGPGRAGMNKYGYTYDQWTALSPKAQDKARHPPAATKPVDQQTAFKQKFYAQFGVQPASTSQISGAQDTLKQAQSTIRLVRQSNPNMSREQLGAALLNGQPGVTQNGKKGMAIPKIRGLWVTVALDLAYNGYVSQRTQDQLHNAGFLASQFSLPTKPPNVPKAPRPKPVASNPFTGSALPIAAP